MRDDDAEAEAEMLAWWTRVMTITRVVSTDGRDGVSAMAMVRLRCDARGADQRRVGG